MTDLPWIAQNLADELAGAIHHTATYIVHRPEHHDQVIAAGAQREYGHADDPNPHRTQDDEENKR